MTRSVSLRSLFSFVASMLVLAAMMATAATAASAAAPASSVRIDAYLGLWEGVDALDGSLVRLSLSDVNEDGVLELTQTESFYSFCHAKGASFSLGHGVEVGTATVAQKRDALKIDIQLICIDDGNGKHAESPIANEYQLRSRGKTLVIPAFPTSLPIVLHRIAQ
jgi:hypothetical protein